MQAKKSRTFVKNIDLLWFSYSSKQFYSVRIFKHFIVICQATFKQHFIVFQECTFPLSCITCYNRHKEVYQKLWFTCSSESSWKFQIDKISPLYVQQLSNNVSFLRAHFPLSCITCYNRHKQWNQEFYQKYRFPCFMVKFF